MLVWPFLSCLLEESTSIDTKSIRKFLLLLFNSNGFFAQILSLSGFYLVCFESKHILIFGRVYVIVKQTYSSNLLLTNRR